MVTALLDSRGQGRQCPGLFHFPDQGHIRFRVQDLLRIDQPVVRSETPGGDVQVVGAGLLQTSGRSAWLSSDGQSFLDPVLGAVDAHPDDEVLADDCRIAWRISTANRVRFSMSVATVLVMPPVPGPGEETVDQVIVRPVHLHAVEARLLGPLGGLDEFLHEDLDFLDLVSSLGRG